MGKQKSVSFYTIIDKNTSIVLEIYPSSIIEINISLTNPLPLKDIEDIKTELKQDNKIFNMTDEEKRYQYLRRTSDSVAAISEAFKKVKAREYKDRMARHSEEVKLYEKIKKAKWLQQEYDTALRKAKLNLREKENER